MILILEGRKAAMVYVYTRGRRSCEMKSRRVFYQQADLISEAIGVMIGCVRLPGELVTIEKHINGYRGTASSLL